MTRDVKLSRRAALARLGLSGLAAYIAPNVAGLSRARAATAPSKPSDASPPSPPSDASNPTAPSGPETSGPRASRPSGPGACRVPQSDGPAQISRQEYQRAQRAISRGEARPLRDVLNAVLRVHPGRLVQVGFSESGPAPLYRMQIVEGSGAVLAVSVNAATGQILSVRNC